jgi:DNA-binding HxlR family transcriptional regulator
MRSYNQFCAVAKSLDVVGERWTLLIVRELLLRGPSRYTDLRNGLPGIATNLLADRLQALESAGVVAREDAPPPIATTLFSLTSRGRELASVIRELGRWGLPFMGIQSPDDAFESHWLTLPVQLFLRDRDPKSDPVTIELQAGDESAFLRVGGGDIEVLYRYDGETNATVTGEPAQILQLLSGKASISQARHHGVRIKGSAEALTRVLPGGTRPAGVQAVSGPARTRSR